LGLHHIDALFHAREPSQHHEACVSTGKSCLGTWVGRFLFFVVINNPCIHLLAGFFECIARRLSV
jgi:hypothetical protein